MSVTLLLYWLAKHNHKGPAAPRLCMLTMLVVTASPENPQPDLFSPRNTVFILYLWDSVGCGRGCVQLNPLRGDAPHVIQSDVETLYILSVTVSR